jgi:hypothetical protein
MADLTVPVSAPKYGAVENDENTIVIATPDGYRLGSEGTLLKLNVNKSPEIPITIRIASQRR